MDSLINFELLYAYSILLSWLILAFCDILIRRETDIGIALLAFVWPISVPFAIFRVIQVSYPKKRGDKNES
jgi:hypothetical protein